MGKRSNRAFQTRIIGLQGGTGVCKIREIDCCTMQQQRKKGIIAVKLEKNAAGIGIPLYVYS